MPYQILAHVRLVLSLFDHNAHLEVVFDLQLRQRVITDQVEVCPEPHMGPFSQVRIAAAASSGMVPQAVCVAIRHTR
jgi:hypothetical protein